MKIANIKDTVFNAIKELWRFKEFFQGGNGLYSMGRLVTFIVVVTVCYDAVWTLAVFHKTWEFGFEKMIFAITAISAKTGALLIEKKFNLGGLNNNDTGTAAGSADSTGTTDTDDTSTEKDQKDTNG